MAWWASRAWGSAALPPTLSGGEADVTTLTARLRRRPAGRQHLAKPRLAGLVTSRKDGRRVVYTLPDGHLARSSPRP